MEKRLRFMNIEIYGTLGPSCFDIPVLTKMFENGMTGVRLNLSHTNLTDCTDILHNFQEAARNASVSPKLLIDLRGPELRIGELESQTLRKDDLIFLKFDTACVDAPQDLPVIPCPDIIFPYLSVGQHILLNDGMIEAEVTDRLCVCRVLRGGPLSSRKSIALPGAHIHPPTLTAADLENLDQAAACHVTGVMLPFVRNKDDLLTLRKELAKRNLQHIRIFAKIENQEGVRMLPELLPHCDHIVIARGDLGNAVTLQKLISIQKQMAALCLSEHMPFMVVTQMLSSMEKNPVPTRAEVSDIFNAVLDGASSLMLTGETAIGAYPAEAIRYMAETAAEASRYAAESTGSFFRIRNNEKSSGHIARSLVPF
jgi:pyruvate kinase